MILNKSEILERLKATPPMVSNIKDINLQLQPAALDLTVKEIYTCKTAGVLDFDNSKRVLSEKDKVKPKYENGKDEIYCLTPGSYQIVTNEQFNMPLDILGFTTSRSSLQRCWAAVIRGFFDPGFVGTGVSLLVVYNPEGLKLYKDARVSQMEFQLINTTEGYNGAYLEKRG